MKIIKIKKLFYKEYAYKIVLFHPSILRVKLPLDQQLSITIRFEKFLKSLKSPEYRVRKEGYRFSLFFNNYEFFETVTAKFNLLLEEFHKPDSLAQLTCLKNNRRVETCKKLPHECRYKILLNTRINQNAAPLGSLIRFVEKNPDNFKLTRAASRALSTSKSYNPNSYFYVKDSKSLLMVQMMVQPIIKEIVELRTYDEVKKEGKIENVEC
jgi:hypothetical protein